jgi:ORF6N domain
VVDRKVPAEPTPGGASASSQHISQAIVLLRGHKVLLDAALAELYGVPTRVLLQAVRRNRRRFPQDFMLQLTAAEWIDLRSQLQAVSQCIWQYVRTA